MILENNQRVRLVGIDAPEIENKKYGRKGEYYGEEARSFLKKLIEGKNIRLVDGNEPFDRYGRRLAFIYLGDTFVNAELMRQGCAKVIRTIDFEYKDQFLELEMQARSQGLGLWANGAKIPERTLHRERKKSIPNFGIVVAVGLLLLFIAGIFRKRT